MATKKEKLETLDTLLLDKMIDILESGNDEDLDLLSSLSVPMNYLRNNQVLSEKPKSTVEEDTKKRLQAAKDRRAKGEER
ncbi:MAG TPA: hypothetical protein ENI14_03080 [Thermoplasmatales archaeon]|nr:hypothetical protein [Thermoplasmatales archaeon]